MISSQFFRLSLSSRSTLKIKMRMVSLTQLSLKTTAFYRRSKLQWQRARPLLLPTKLQLLRTTSQSWWMWTRPVQQSEMISNTFIIILSFNYSRKRAQELDISKLILSLFLEYLNHNRDKSMDPFAQDVFDQMEPPLSASGMHRQEKQEIDITVDNETKPDAQNALEINQPFKEEKHENVPSGCTKYCKLDFYKQFFNIGETEVISRIKSAITIPATEDFIQRTDNKPDFYGPFWVFTTIIFLIGFTGNLSNYFLSKITSGEVWESYFFKLEYIRYGVSFIYPFGFGIPAGLFFLFKFLGKNMNIQLPDMICVYGYSLTCFIPAIALCLIPLGFLQWILMLAAGAISGFFLFNSLKNHLEGINNPVLALAITIVQLLLSLVLKIEFLELLS